jgi:hypothetical protein
MHLSYNLKVYQIFLLAHISGSVRYHLAMTLTESLSETLQQRRNTKAFDKLRLQLARAV